MNHRVTTGLLMMLLAWLAAPTGRAQEELQTEIVLDGVEVTGERHFSSVDVPREPRVRLTNTTSEVRTVVLTALYGLDGVSRVPLTLRRPISITLAPGESHDLTIDFDGTAPVLGAGLPYSRFAVLARVGRASGEVIASVGYQCRIPIRH